MAWVEIRRLWNKNLMLSTPKEIAEARRLSSSNITCAFPNLATTLVQSGLAPARRFPKFRQGARDSFLRRFYF